MNFRMEIVWVVVLAIVLQEYAHVTLGILDLIVVAMYVLEMGIVMDKDHVNAGNKSNFKR
jgi:hypothetical protein